MQLQVTTGVPDSAYVYVLDVFVKRQKAQLAERVTSNLGKKQQARLWWRPVASLGVAARDFDLLRLIAAFPPSSTAFMDTPETPAASSADAPWNPQYVAIAILIVVVPVVLWRRRGGSSEDDNYETDETGRRRKIMHGDL